VVLAILLAAWEPHVAVAPGAGVAYGRLGVHLELIAGHVGLFGGVGHDTYVDEGPSLAAGVRFFSGQGEGALLSLNFAYLQKHIEVTPGYPYEYADLEDVYLGATFGWRWRADVMFGEVGLGPAWLRARSRNAPPVTPWPLPSGCLGGWPYSCDNRRVLLDLTAAIGLQF